jgi:anaerobic selenocysteine-containing dehydrogenase
MDMNETDRIRWIKTHCARMDHGGCGLLVKVKENRIIKVKADPDGYLNNGYICSKAIASPDRLTHRARLKSPLKRVGNRGQGKWEKISWKTALSIISENLNQIKEKHGARSIAFCQGMPKGLEHFVLIRLANIFGSPNVVAVQDVCHAPREIAGKHTCGFYPVADFHHKSKLILLWGANPTHTNEEGAISGLMVDQINKGTKLIGIDPRKTDLAEKAERWLQIKPGTDNALALGFLNVIIKENLYDQAFVENYTKGFDQLAEHVKKYTPEKISEITCVPANLITETARAFASAHPAAIAWGNSIEHNVNTFDTTRAIVCLMAITGNLDVPGGNIQALEPNILPLGKFVRADLIPNKRKEMIHAYYQTIPGLMTVPPAFFRKGVLEEIPYAIRGAYMQCTNPLLAYADSRQTMQALMKLDFIAVSDIFMTPTACFADIVLPAATHFEFNDIGHYGLGHGIILARPKIVEPPENCWPDIRILNQLGKKLNQDKYWYDNYEDICERLLLPAGLNYREFAEKGYLKGPDKFKKYLKKGFKTPTGKVELALTKAEKFGIPRLPCFSQIPEPADDNYPLILICCKDRNYLHSSYRWVKKLRDRSTEAVAEIHPETAAQNSVENGDEIRIETKSGAIVQKACVTENIAPGLVSAAYGWWFPGTNPESQYDWQRANYNMLTSTDKLGKQFGTPNLKAINCRIKKMEQEKS